MWRFFLISIISSVSALAASYELGPVRVPAPATTKVSAQLVVTQVFEVEILKQARVLEPRLVFDTDFGLGLEVLPDINVKSETEYAYVAGWICRELGYGPPVAVAGTRTVPNGHVLQYWGDPARPEGPGLKVVAIAPEKNQVPSTLICKLKKD
jgi:hypothetical protein